MDNVQGKDWFKSKTIAGAITSIVSLILMIIGIKIDSETQKIIVENINAIVGAIGVIIGSILAIYGRFKAKQPIK